MLVKEKKKNPPNENCSPYWYTVILFPVTEVSSLTWNWGGKCGERWDSLGNWHFQEHGEVDCFSTVFPSSLPVQFSSVQFSRSVMSDSLRPHGLQHTRPPYASPTPGVYPNSCPLSRLWHPAISSSVISFSSCLQSFPASGSFPVSQLFASGGQSIGVSASTSVLPVNTQDWSPLGWTGWISLQSKGLSRVFSSTIVQKHQFFSAQVQLSHPYMTTGKTIALTRWTFATG